MNRRLIIETLIKRVKSRLLKERKSDELSLNLSRLIVNKFKEKEDFELEAVYFERGDEYASFDFYCYFVEDIEIDEPFSIYANADMQIMEIEVTYNPKYFPESMVDFVAEIKEAVEHELEHIEQQNFEDMEIHDDDDYEDDDYFSYYTSNTEIPAFVRGLIKRSKTKKITLSDAMEEWFSENKKWFKNPKEEWPIVKGIWMRYANEMKEKRRIKKFK